MGQKNFGVAVSGYLDPTDRAFEQAVYQSGKPILDKELNLSDELSSAFGTEPVRRATPSGWLSRETLDTASPLQIGFTATPNLLLLGQFQALVNGWFVAVQATTNASVSLNQVALGASPSGSGSKRTDLVFLEVWRRLISPAPDTVGKSTGGRIWRNGNVKIPAVNDVALNFADDIKDGTLNAESTKRVQIQYRLRVVPGVDVFTYQSGIADPVVVANSVPASAVLPDGVATAFNYANQSVAGDPGLWRAGDGNPANTLGTVDGYMYAVPLLAVFRRNTTAFNRNLNHNGGVATPGPSDRPDGLFHDVVDIADILDLRAMVSLTGWNYQEIAEKNLAYLFDNRLRTACATTGIGGGTNGHTLFWADEIGVLPGDGTITGDTPGAEFVGQFDCTRRFFSDRPNYEVMTYVIAPGNPNVSTATWQNGTVITISPSQISQYPYSGGIGFLSRAPSGTRILDVVRARIQGTLTTEKGIDVGQVGGAFPLITSTVIPVKTVTGLGNYAPSDIVITLGTISGGITTEPIYVDLLVAYPSGAGLSKTPTNTFGSASFLINNPGALPATPPTYFSTMQTQAFDAPHREAQLQYRTVSLTYTFSADSTVATLKYFLPERVHALTAVRINGVPYAGAFGVDPSGRLLTLSGGPSTAPGDVVAVDYTALRPMPQSGVQMTLYYNAMAPQTIQSSTLGTTLDVVPRWISPHLYSITAGSGSLGEAYPYPFAYVQTGGILADGVAWSGEHELDGSVEMSVADFNASTGFLKLSTYVPYTPNPDEVFFTRSLIDTDIEGRTYFPAPNLSFYQPSAFAQSLSNDRVHKVVLPTLMEVTSDQTYGEKGTLLLVLFVRWAAFDDENSVKFLTANNTTVAAVFRVSGNLLNGRS